MPRAAPIHVCAQAILTEDASAGGLITREDVATLVCKALFSKKADNKVGAVAGERRSAVGGCRASRLGLGRLGKRGEPLWCAKGGGAGAVWGGEHAKAVTDGE